MNSYWWRAFSKHITRSFFFVRLSPRWITGPPLNQRNCARADRTFETPYVVRSCRLSDVSGMAGRGSDTSGKTYFGLLRYGNGRRTDTRCTVVEPRDGVRECARARFLLAGGSVVRWLNDCVRAVIGFGIESSSASAPPAARHTYAHAGFRSELIRRMSKDWKRSSNTVQPNFHNFSLCHECWNDYRITTAPI